MEYKKTIKTAGELRELARLDPKGAFSFINKNIPLWNEFVNSDPFDSADVLEELEPQEAAILIESLQAISAINLFSHLRPRAVIGIMEYIDLDISSSIFENLATEDIVDILKKSTEDEINELLSIVSKSTRLDIDRRLAYPEDSVGRLMSVA